jgi:hypothetical protein
MSENQILDNQYATLVYHTDAKVVHHTFHKPIGAEKFREVLNLGVTAMAKYGASKWLSDDRNNSVLSDEDTEWSKNNWFPRALQAGWKYWALVVPQDILAQMNLKEFVDTYFDQGLRIMVFTDPRDAMKWLADIDRS